MNHNKRARPIIGVGGIIFCNTRVLLVRRKKPPKKDEWSLPGGRQELGETMIEAVRREVFEETGITAEIRGLVDAVDYIDRTGDGTIAYHYSLIDYWGISLETTPHPASDASDAKFYSLEQALSLPLWSETKRIILQADALRRAFSREDRHNAGYKTVKP